MTELTILIICLCLVFMFLGLRFTIPLVMMAMFVLILIAAIKIFAKFIRWTVGNDHIDTTNGRIQTVHDPRRRVCQNPNCGWVNVAQARFCARCGSPFN